MAANLTFAVTTSSLACCSSVCSSFVRLIPAPLFERTATSSILSTFVLTLSRTFGQKDCTIYTSQYTTYSRFEPRRRTFYHTFFLEPFFSGEQPSSTNTSHTFSPTDPMETETTSTTAPRRPHEYWCHQVRSMHLNTMRITLIMFTRLVILPNRPNAWH